MNPPRHLALPPAKPARFKRNFIRQAVCELRFPTLFELEAARPPLNFSQALRKEYPTYEPLSDLNLSGASVAQAHAHLFKSKRSHWAVTLRASAITLETSHYTSFDEFEDRLTFILKAAEKIIDSDFFTRVGLRYINGVPFNNEDIRKWINPVLVEVLGSGIYGDVQEHSQRVSGTTLLGGYMFQHGLRIEKQTMQPEYVLDFDFFREDVTVAETIEVVRNLHEQEFSMFSWALGEQAKAHLGPSTLKDSEA